MFRRAIGVTDSIVVNCDFNRRLLAISPGRSTPRAQVIRHYAEIPPTSSGRGARLIVGGFSERKGHDAVQGHSCPGRNAEGRVWVAGTLARWMW